MEEEDQYDEFGNHIGPEVQEDDEEVNLFFKIPL